MKLKMILLTLLLCCYGAAWAQAESEAQNRSPSAEGASVGFANLEDGQTVPLVFEVRFQLSGMGIAPAGSNIENTGHHHLLIDVTELPDFDQPLPANDNIRHFGKGQSETELSLPEGPHTLQLLLADYRHIPHEPPVMSDVITIVVSADAPPPVESDN